LTQVQVSELVAKHERGVAINEIAATFGIHRTTVMTHLDRAGVQRRTGRMQRSLGEARSMYESGASLSCVAKQFGVDAETVRRAFKSAGTSLRHGRGWQY
jgi:transposase-like protein